MNNTVYTLTWLPPVTQLFKLFSMDHFVLKTYNTYIQLFLHVVHKDLTEIIIIKCIIYSAK
jgi:hypothetical protein